MLSNWNTPLGLAELKVVPLVVEKPISHLHRVGAQHLRKIITECPDLTDIARRGRRTQAIRCVQGRSCRVAGCGSAAKGRKERRVVVWNTQVAWPILAFRRHKRIVPKPVEAKPHVVQSRRAE